MTGHQAALKADLLLEHAAGGLDDVAFDLVADAVWIDHQASVMTDGNLGDVDLASAAVDLNVGHPGCPGCAIARKLAVDVERIGEPSAAQDVPVSTERPSARVGDPIGALGDRPDQFDRTGILEVA